MGESCSVDNLQRQGKRCKWCITQSHILPKQDELIPIITQTRSQKKSYMRVIVFLGLSWEMEEHIWSPNHSDVTRT